MELPDFTEFVPFNQLRESIGTTELGYFELFDPQRHLTGAERSELERVGFMTTIGQLESTVLNQVPQKEPQKEQIIATLPDKTLAYKNSRVIAYIPDANWYRLHREYPSYHVARCTMLEGLSRDNPTLPLLATSRISEEYPLVAIDSVGQVAKKAQSLVVCRHCLHALRYKDYDEYRNRRRGYSQRVLDQFSLKDFFRLYKRYPLGFNASRSKQS